MQEGLEVRMVPRVPDCRRHCYYISLVIFGISAFGPEDLGVTFASAQGPVEQSIRSGTIFSAYSWNKSPRRDRFIYNSADHFLLLLSHQGR